MQSYGDVASDLGHILSREITRTFVEAYLPFLAGSFSGTPQLFTNTPCRKEVTVGNTIPDILGGGCPVGVGSCLFLLVSPIHPTHCCCNYNPCTALGKKESPACDGLIVPLWHHVNFH